jgi:hypothetical protein
MRRGRARVIRHRARGHFADVHTSLDLPQSDTSPRLVCLCFAVVDHSGCVSPSSPFPSDAQKQRRILPAIVIFTSAALCQRALRAAYRGYLLSPLTFQRV